jgi:phenylalanyl-tRNA synthetase beta chain
MVAGGVRRGTAAFTGAGRHWAGNAAPVGVFDAKADAEAALAPAGAPVDKLMVFAEAPDWLHPGRSGELIKLGPKTVLAHFGELHPRVMRSTSTGRSAASRCSSTRSPCPRARADPLQGRLQRQRPDAGAPRLRLRRRRGGDRRQADQGRARRRQGADRRRHLFDVYRGKGIEEGRKSLAIDVTLQPRDKTLTDEDIDAVAARIRAAVEKATGGTLRG